MREPDEQSAYQLVAHALQLLRLEVQIDTRSWQLVASCSRTGVQKRLRKAKQRNKEMRSMKKLRVHHELVAKLRSNLASIWHPSI